MSPWMMGGLRAWRWTRPLAVPTAMLLLCFQESGCVPFLHLSRSDTLPLGMNWYTRHGSVSRVSEKLQKMCRCQLMGADSINAAKLSMRQQT